MNSGIYKIEDRHGRVYIGSAINIPRRWLEHKRRLYKGIHENSHLQNVYNKYGAEYFTFSVLEYCDKDKLLHYEQIWLNILFDSLDRDNVFNKNICAYSRLGSKLSAESKDKIRKAHIGKTASIETIEKLQNRATTIYHLVNPKGEQIKILNLKKFCRDNDLDFSCMLKVSKGKRKSHKGWTNSPKS